MATMLKVSLALLAAQAGATEYWPCFAGTGPEYTMYLPYHDVNLTVPQIPTDSTLYAYASDNAIVAVPEPCVESFRGRLGVADNFYDRDGERGGMYYFRVSDPANEYAMLTEMKHCACGLVILLHGTSGVTWQTVAYARMMAGSGHLVVMPDSHAMPDSMGLKGKRPLKPTADINTSGYWGSSNPYEGSCSGFSKPFCYSTKVENILYDSANYREYVERNYLIRKLELDYFVESQKEVLAAFNKVFLLGRSEGAMVAARYHNEILDAMLTGRITSGWSCNFNYYVSCADHAKVCEDKCRKSVPQLNLVGQNDGYFGGKGSDSISWQVAQARNGYGRDLTGNCRAAFDEQGFTNSTVVVFPDTGHSLEPTDDNAVRSLLADFVNSAAAPSSWGSLNRTGCSETRGVWNCTDSGNGSTTYSDSWGTKVVDSWGFVGTNCTICSTEASSVASASSAFVGLALLGLVVSGTWGLTLRYRPERCERDISDAEADGLEGRDLLLNEASV